MVLLVSAGQGQGHHQTRIASFSSSLALSPGSMLTPPLFSAHNLNFARRSGPMRNGSPAHFQCSPERTGAPSPTMHAPSSRTCSPRPRPPMMGHQTQGWAPFPGRHSLAGRPGSGLAAVSSPPPGVWLSDLVCSTFPKSVQSFQGSPFHVHRPASRPLPLLSFLPFPQTQTCPIAVALLFLFLLFLFCLLRVRVRPNSSPWAAQVSLFFENTAPTSLVPSFTSSALLYALPLSTVTDSSSSIDARPSTPLLNLDQALSFPASNTHTRSFCPLSARLLRRTSSPRPDDTHPRVANVLPSSDPVSVSVDGPPHHRSPTFRQGPTSPTPSSSSFLLLDIQFFHLLSQKKCPLNRRGILAIICVIGWSRWIRSLKHRRTGAGASVSHPNAYTVGVCRVIFWLFLLGPSRATCPKLPNLGFMVRGTKCWVNLKPGEEGNQYLHRVGLQAHSSKGGLTRYLDRYHSNFSLTRCALSDLSSSSQLADLYGCQPPIVDDTPHPRSTIPQQSESQ